MNKYLTLIPLALALAACEGFSVSPKAHFNRGSPESLLETSSEQITVGLSASDGLRQLHEWTATDRPSHVQLQCEAKNPICKKAQELLKSRGIAYVQSTPPADPKALLTYDRISARDCEQRFIDQRQNSYNLNYPTFGCATAANIVQHVSDKRELVNPKLMGAQDAAKGVQTYNNYLRPPEVRQTQDTKSLLNDLQQSGGSGR